MRSSRAYSIAARVSILVGSGACLRTHQQARTGNRREGHRRQQFGIVAQTMLRIGAGPGEIENKLAARMGFAEQRHRSREISCGVFHHEMLGLPAGAWRGASGFLQRQQKFVPQKRLGAAGKRIPTLRIDLRNAVEKSRRREASRVGSARFGVGLGFQFAPSICRHRAPPCIRCRPR